MVIPGSRMTDNRLLENSRVAGRIRARGVVTASAALSGVAMLPPAYKISPADLTRGHAAFEKNEPRDLFYRAATALVSFALAETATTNTFPVADALAVLLQTWNVSFYRFKRKTFDRAKHFMDIEGLISTNRSVLATYRNATIEKLDDVVDHMQICALFNECDAVLGPVGAAKALHLLAPKFFPLWDREIAKWYKCPLVGVGSNGERYWRFMKIAQEQCIDLKIKVRTF